MGVLFFISYGGEKSERVTDLVHSGRLEIISLGLYTVARIEVEAGGRIECDARRQTQPLPLSVRISHGWKQSERAHCRNVIDHSRIRAQVCRQLPCRQRVVERGLLRASRASDQSGANDGVGVCAEVPLEPR